MSKLVNFVVAWHPCHSHQSKIIPFRIGNTCDAMERRKKWFVDFDIMCVCVWGVEESFLSNTTNITFIRITLSRMLSFRKCVTIYTLIHCTHSEWEWGESERERVSGNETLMQLSFYTLAIVVMGPCLPSDFFGMFIIHDRGWLWFLQ